MCEPGTAVAGAFALELAIGPGLRLVGAVLLKPNDEWQLRHCYMGVEAMDEMLSPAPGNGTLQLPPKAA